MTPHLTEQTDRLAVSCQLVLFTAPAYGSEQPHPLEPSTESYPVRACPSAWLLMVPSAASRYREVPRVGVEKVEGACGCSRVPEAYAPPSSVPVCSKVGKLSARAAM